MNLRQVTETNMFWTIIDKTCYNSLNFIFQIILARLLSPTDYGIIGYVVIFISFSQIIVNGGLGMAIIQDQQNTSLDNSTIFWYNFSLSLLMYLSLFFVAPLIANFFKQPILIKVIRILSLNLIIGAFVVVQQNLLSKNFKMKSIAITNVVSLVIGAFIGIYGAYNHWGVWALVCQNLTFTLATVFFFWSFSTWKPDFVFSISSFKKNFNFGYKLILSGIYANIINNTVNIIIGKKYPTAKLGFYTRGLQFSDMVAFSFSAILQQATFPIFAKIQSDKELFRTILKKLLCFSAFIMFPIMTLLYVLAEPIVITLLTEKWRNLIPFIQILVFYRVLYPMAALSLQSFNAIGRSDIFLKSELIKFPIILTAYIIAFHYNLETLLLINIGVMLINYYITSFYINKIFDYSYWHQLKDFLPFIILSLIMGLIVMGLRLVIPNFVIQIALGVIIGLPCYIVGVKLLKLPEYNEAKKTLKTMYLKFKPTTIIK